MITTVLTTKATTAAAATTSGRGRNDGTTAIGLTLRRWRPNNPSAAGQRGTAAADDYNTRVRHRRRPLRPLPHCFHAKDDRIRFIMRTSMYYIGVTFFLIFFSTAFETFFFLLTPRRSSWPRSNRYTNDFGLIFCFLSLAPTLTPSFTLFHSFWVSVFLHLSIPLSHTHSHTSLGCRHTLNDVYSLYFKSITACPFSTTHFPQTRRSTQTRWHFSI